MIAVGTRTDGEHEVDGLERTGGTIGPEVAVPGSQQLVPTLLVLLTVVLVLAAIGLGLARWVRSRRGRPSRRPVALVIVSTSAILVGLGAWVSKPPTFFVPELGPLPALTPADNVFRVDTRELPVSPDSDRWIATIAGQQLISGFSGEVVDGVVFGNPYNFVDDSTPRKEVDIVAWPEGSFPGPYPITDPAYIESMPTYGFDMHYLAVDPATADAWELLSARSWFGRWEADSGAHYRTDSNDYPLGSTIAAGLPLLPGVVTYDEVASGSVDHLILAGIDTTAKGEWVWPARATDGRSTDPDAPPQGAWLRLRADADLSTLGPQALVVARALQTHGLILSDTGPHFGLRGTADGRWDNVDLSTLSALSAGDFEVVDPAGIRVAEDSLAVRR